MAQSWCEKWYLHEITRNFVGLLNAVSSKTSNMPRGHPADTRDILDAENVQGDFARKVMF